MKCSGKSILLLFLMTISLYFVSHQLVYRYGRKLYVYQDGSHHPLTSLLAKKIDGDYIYGRNNITWHWKPQSFVDSSHLGVQLTADPSVLNNGEVTTVRWINPQLHVRMDILALYCPSNSSSDRFTDYWEIDSFPGLKRSDKKGEVKIALYNVRVCCEFRMFFVGDNDVELVAISNRIDFIEAPLHLHLSLTGVPSQMRVQWTSWHPYTPVVLYGHSPTDLKYTATGSWRSYTNKDMCGPPANLTTFFLHPGYLHDVLLTNLESNTRYFYRCGGINFNYSPIKNFTTSLVRGSPDTFSFAVYGDMDITSYPGAEATAKLLLKGATEQDSLSFVLHIGDISYANGFSYRWEEWMTMIEPYSSLIPYMVSVGNHDQVTAKGLGKDPSGGSTVKHAGSVHDSGGECGIPLYNRFHMPDNGNHLWWYSFDYGSVHITQISSEHDLSPGSVQFQWLHNDLMKVDSLVTPWKIVTLHRPMYTSEKLINEPIVGKQLRQDIEELLTDNKVDLFISGHNHAYERTCKIYNSQCDNGKGIVNIVVGTGGMQLDYDTIWKFEWSRHFEVNFGFGRVTVNRTDLLWEFVRNKDEAVADSVKLRKRS